MNARGHKPYSSSLEWLYGTIHLDASIMLQFFFLPFLLPPSSLVFDWDIFSASTCFTHFCSSMRKARITRVRVQRAQREPPYALFTRRSRFFKRLYSTGRKRGKPINALPQSPQCGPLAFFLSVWKVSLPPGVLRVRCLFDFVL